MAAKQDSSEQRIEQARVAYTQHDAEASRQVHAAHLFGDAEIAPEAHLTYVEADVPRDILA